MKKINGEIQIENKRKAVIVEQLVSMGFDPDPVKKWKELQKKKEMEATGEIITEEGSDGENEENEGEEDEHNRKEPKNAQQKDLESKLSDYDYLVGMAIVRLSSEEKDKLLRESGDKLEELKVQQSIFISV
ncbi:unnamed protein product [Anisakis simplex]|uniref:Uncharacterized protein n=2 Tax=Anisakis simplex TaxID=6269 RepID=A0A3P6PUA6_ANISI|nr:unnamed protein product [Anisakis simplex]